MSETQGEGGKPVITQEQYSLAIAAKEAAEATILAYERQNADDFNARWKRFQAGEVKFTDAELTYSAGARCEKCNAGLAYPSNCGGYHQWDCSAVLKGEATDREHASYPFAFYSIKSENQPSAQGHTTRPR